MRFAKILGHVAFMVTYVKSQDFLERASSLAASTLKDSDDQK